MRGSSGFNASNHSERRAGDDRFFRVDTDTCNGSVWYYRAREGTFGPFPTREQATTHFSELSEASATRRRDRYRSLVLILNRFWRR